MLRHSARALSLSSFGREKALKLERASVWTSRCCCCQLSTLDRTPEEKLLEGKSNVGMLLSYSGCQILQFSNQMHETICAVRSKNTSPRANKCKLAKRSVFSFTDTVYIILMSTLGVIITSAHSFFSSTRTTQSPEVKKKQKQKKIKQERIMYHLFQQKKHQE